MNTPDTEVSEAQKRRDDIKEQIDENLRLTSHVLYINTQDTEWEKEFDEKFVNDALDAFPEHPQTMLLLLTNIKSFITNLLSSRDTYWKERVREERKKWQTWVSHDVTCYLYTEEGDSKDCTCGLYHAYQSELDNLK